MGEALGGTAFLKCQIERNDDDDVFFAECLSATNEKLAFYVSSEMIDWSTNTIRVVLVEDVADDNDLVRVLVPFGMYKDMPRGIAFVVEKNALARPLAESKVA